jgi:hypothetical protein
VRENEKSAKILDMRRIICISGLAVISTLFCACSVNLFQGFANTSSDEALLIDAKTLIDQKNYTKALLNFPQMSTAYQSREDVIVLQASAYAGQGGLDFLNFAYQLQNNLQGTNIFTFLFKAFENGSAAKMSSLFQAQNLILSKISSNAASLTNDENVLLAMIEFAYVGYVISRYADTNSNGIPDPGVNVCTVFPSALATDAGPQMGAAINIAINSLTQLSNNGINLASSISILSTACTAIPAGYNFCGITDPATFAGPGPTNIMKGVLSMVKESTIVGIGTCTGDVGICNCLP